MEQYAYIRVSTREQNIDRQILALKPYHIPKENVFCDYQSGKDFERPAYQNLMKILKEGDLLVIKSIDRLGRSYNDILVQWQYITKELKADIVVLDMELLDTRTREGSLTGTLIADLVLQIFAYVAQTEREFIRQRQAEGIAAARVKGNKKVTKITIGNNVSVIGKNAFSGCSKLKTVTIGKHVTTIGANAFKSCKKLEKIVIQSSKLTSKTVAKSAFKGVPKNATIKVPKNKLKAYKKLLKSKGLSTKVKVKK